MQQSQPNHTLLRGRRCAKRDGVALLGRREKMNERGSFMATGVLRDQIASRGANLEPRIQRGRASPEIDLPFEGWLIGERLGRSGREQAHLEIRIGTETL